MPSGTFHPKSEIRFRIKLKSGRVLGPLDLRRIALFILKNQIVGDELAQQDAAGSEWKKVTLFPEIADLLLAKLEGRLNKDSIRRVEEIVPAAGVGETQVLSEPEISPPPPPPRNEDEPPPVPTKGGTRVAPTAATGPESAEKDGTLAKSGSLVLQELDETDARTVAASSIDLIASRKKPIKLGERPEAERVELETRPGVNKDPDKKKKRGPFDDYDSGEEERTYDSQAATVYENPKDRKKNKKKKTKTNEPRTQENKIELIREDGGFELQLEGLGGSSGGVADQRTIVMQTPSAGGGFGGFGRPSGTGRGGSGSGKKPSVGAKLRAAVIGAGLAWLAYETYVKEPEKTPVAQLTHIRAKLPGQVGRVDPKRAQDLYIQGVRYYLLDTIEGYTRAAERFLTAATLDPGEVKTLAMLASSYLNLIDASNKDESYFSVILKLIELSRAKSLDLAETVVADVEYYIMANKAEAAQNRIIEYTRVQRSFPIDMYYYLAYAYYHRGDYRTAARYLAQFPDNKANSPKIFYLRAMLAYQLTTKEEALLELERAIKLSPTHAKSRLKIAEIVDEQGKLTQASPHLQYLIANPQLMTAQELAKAYFLFGKLRGFLGSSSDALAEIERAVSLDKTNSRYLLELYTLRAKTGQAVSSVRKRARMYYFMGEGERALQEAKDQEALSFFMQAAEADGESALPLVRIGDIFVRSNDWVTALLNYRKAFKLSSKNLTTASKYIQALIQNYEWKEVESALQKLRGIPDADSALDKLYGDMFAKQGQNLEAVGWYKKAMSREVIDPEVYMAFGRALMATKNYSDPPLFFALALRFDPLNLEAVIATAQCLAQTDSIERAIRMIQDEIQKARFPRAELYAAVAQLQTQKGDWLSALQSVNQAIEANKDYPLSYKVRAEIHMNAISTGGLKGREEKKRLAEALDAYKAYSDRNISDPSGYLERFRILAERARYSEAEEEILRIFDRFPKYPGLHLLKGNLYLVKGQHDQAFDEYQLELKNNPNHVETLVAIGKEYIVQNKYDLALEAFNRAMKLAPQFSEPKHWAGYTNFLMKNYHGAVALYLTALQIDQGNPMIYKRLGVAYKSLGNAPEAAKAFKRYLDLAPDAPDRAEIERYQ